MSRLLPSAQAVSVSHGRVIFRQNGPMPHVYFPMTCVFGIVVVVEDGKQIEGATIGREGMVGLPVFLGLDFHPYLAVAELPGEALQVPAAAFLHAARPGSTLDQLLRRYAQHRLRCANQIGACNALHSVEGRIARWLLMARDLAGKDEVQVTHEFLSGLLGVRRQSVSMAAKTLERAGFIRSGRGALRVEDRKGLEAASCDCYAVIKQMYDRIMRF